jgi:L-amino acid ligase C-terminal domain 2
VRLLVLGAGPPQLGVLAAARRRGLTVVAADRDPSAPGFRYADRRAVVSIEDEPAIDRLARAEQVDGLIAAGTDHAVAIAARVAHRLGLPHPLEPEAGVVSVSELRQRERLAAAGIVQPLLEELPGWLRTVAVHAFVLDGRFVPLLLTDPDPARPPVSAHLYPAELDEDAAGAVRDAAAAATAALGIENGPVTTQVVLGLPEPLVAKVSARLGGAHEAELCRIALGIDACGLAIAAALGEPLHEGDLEPTLDGGGACVRFLVAPRGVLVAVEGVESAWTVQGVRSIRVYREPGHVFGEPLRASHRAGAVIATGATRAEAAEAAAEAARRIRFLTAPAEAVA